MSSLSPRLQVRVQQKQILTPGLVQMVSLLQLNRLELKDMISAEIAQNPVLEEAGDGGEELTPEELQPLLEAERAGDPADQSILEVTAEPSDSADGDGEGSSIMESLGSVQTDPLPVSGDIPAADLIETKTADPFDEIDLGEYFDQYLDPGFKSPALENVEKRTFETFLSSPVTLAEHPHYH